MRRAVLNVVGLSARDLSSGVMPRLAARAAKGSVAKVRPAFPAVTCTAQSDYLTGKQPSTHGIVGNGWYDRTLSEVQFWKQSNRVVLAPKVWDELHAKNPKLKVANLFWWYNMGTAADISVTPRPVYKADGGKIFDIASYPQRFKELLKRDLGDFPFHSFWGPRAGLPSSQWIADSARWIEEHEQPDLSLVYLPHLDYDLQRFGPADPRSDVARRDVDKLVGDLAEFLEARGVEVLIVSEYAITAVDRAVPLNKVFRAHGWLELKPEDGSLTLDTFNSKAFAVVDPQVAPVVVLDPSVRAEVRKVLLATPATLMGFLSAINLTWLQHKQAQQSKEVIEKATNLYKSVADFVENMAGARDGLEAAVKKFNSGLGSYRKYVLPKGQELLEIHGLQPSKFLPEEKDTQDLPTEVRRHENSAE